MRKTIRQRFKEIIDWGSRIQFLWTVGAWIFARIWAMAGGAAMIAVVWAYLTRIPAVFVALAGLLTFGGVLWVGNSIGAWLERRKKITPPETQNKKPKQEHDEVAHIVDRDAKRQVEKHIVDADNAITAGNVNLWLGCYLSRAGEYAWLDGLGRDAKPYLVVKISTCSRFLYDLSFIDVRQIKFTMDIDVDPKRETVPLEAMLIEPQVDPHNTNELPRESISCPHIRSLQVNELHFEFEAANIRDKVIKTNEGHQEPRLLLRPDWRLKTADSREVIYSQSTPIVLELKPFSNVLAFVRDQRKMVG